jgi:hypothetical protein
VCKVVGQFEEFYLLRDFRRTCVCVCVVVWKACSVTANVIVREGEYFCFVISRVKKRYLQARLELNFL